MELTYLNNSTHAVAQRKLYFEELEMFEIEHYKKPTDWSQIALWIVSIIALVVVALDLFVWRA